MLSKDDTSKFCNVYEDMFMIRSSVHCALNPAPFRHNTQCPGVTCALNLYGSYLVYLYANNHVRKTDSCKEHVKYYVNIYIYVYTQ